MRDDTVRLHTRAQCFLCGLPGEAVYGGLHDRICALPGTFGIRRCSACGLYWLDPSPAADDITRYYGPDTAVRFRSETVVPPPLSLRGLKGVLRAGVLCGCYGYAHLHNRHVLCRGRRIFCAFPFLRDAATWQWGPLLPPYARVAGGTVIDIGCGRGDYLAILHALGLKVLGIEMNADAVKTLHGRGIPAVEGTIEKARLPGGSASMITMRHVIEHLADPLATLEECWRVLRPGGMLVARTPNFDSLGHATFGAQWLALDPPRHLFGLTTPGARALFAKTRFRLTTVRSLAHSAEYVFNASVSIRNTGRFHADAPSTRAPGWRRFVWKERALVALGRTAGEELEIVAEKPGP